jgi:hypothetical protein
MELRVSCYSNQIDLHATVRQQQVLAELARIERELDSMPAPDAQQDEVSFLRMQNTLLNKRCVIMDLLMGGWAERAVGVSDIMGECGFSDRIPCRRQLDALVQRQGPATISIREVALGQPVLEWADGRRESHRNDPLYQGRDVGQLELLVWNDLPRELRDLVPQPEPEPLGFTESWYHALKSEAFCLNLWNNLDLMRQDARVEQGNLWCKTCYPNDHRLIKVPRGSMVKKFRSGLKSLRYLRHGKD